MDELEEVGRTADAVRADIEALFVRGLASSAPSDRRGLEVRTEGWERVGASHVASRLRSALDAANADAKDAPKKFLSAYTSLHAFERVLSLEAARASWKRFFEAEVEASEGEASEEKESPQAPPPPRAAAPPPAGAIEDPQATVSSLTDLARVVE